MIYFSVNVEEIRERVWREIRAEDVPITEHQRKDIDALISGCAEKVDAITKSLAGLREDAPVSELEKLLKSHMADDNMKAIREAFRTETFTLNIEKSGDTYVAKFSRGGEVFQENVPLTSKQNVSQTRDQQIASLILEIIFLLLGLAGIRLPLSKSQLQRIIDEILKMIRAGSFQTTIQQLIDRWTRGNARQRAVAIYNFIGDIFNLGILRNILNIVLADMSAWERIRTIAEVILLILLALGSGGLALIAQILLALNDTVKIGEKIRNLILLNELHDKV